MPRLCSKPLSCHLAFTFAEHDAADGHFKSALQWLEVIERLDGVLPSGYLEKRVDWHDRASGRTENLSR